MLYDPGASYTKFDQIEGITEEERSFLRIVDVNAFGNSDKGNSGLYATICRINHSCSPNAFWGVDASDTKLTVQTCRSVEMGEEIVVDYYMFNLFPVRQERISRILEDRLFICRFLELKTMFSQYSLFCL